MEDIELRFVIVTDSHWGRRDRGEENLDRARQQINDLHDQHEIDFVVHCGDIAHDDPSLHSTVVDEFFEELPTEYHVVYGNHDFSTESEWIDDYSQPWQHTWESDNYGFVATETGQPVNDSGRSPADADFLESAIDGFSEKKGVFVFQHVAPFTSTDIVGIDMPDIREQIAREEVIACFLGDNHQKNIREFHDGGRYYYCCSIAGQREAEQPFEVRDDGLRVVDIREQ